MRVRIGFQHHPHRRCVRAFISRFLTRWIFPFESVLFRIQEEGGPRPVTRSRSGCGSSVQSGYPPQADCNLPRSWAVVQFPPGLDPWPIRLSFSGNVLAGPKAAARYFSSAAPATGARSTAASHAVVCSAGCNAVRPTADTSNLLRAEPIIATVKEPTVSGSSKPA